MSHVEISFNSKDVKPENLEQVCAAVSLLLRLTNEDHLHLPWTKHSTTVQNVPADAVGIYGGAAAVLDGEPAPAEPAKKKRKRRTKAEIAADKAAAVTPEPQDNTPDVTVSDTELEVDPLGEAPADQPTVATEAEVKAAVLAAVARLTEAGGSESPTRVVVAKLVELTGKKRVGEIEQGLYRTVIGGLSEI